MVKRNTDYKQVFLVDEFYLKHFNLQNQNLNNTISNNPKISLTTPQSSQYFNNHYNIPTHILNEYNPTNLQTPVTSTFDYLRYYKDPRENSNRNYISKFQTHNSNINRVSEPPNHHNERDYNNSNFNQSNTSNFQTENSRENGTLDRVNLDMQIPHETESNFQNHTRNDMSEQDEIVDPPNPFPYYEDYQKDQENYENSSNKSKISVPKIKDFLNKTQKQLYTCYICNEVFSSILLLEKHNMMKHNKYQSPKQNISDRNDAILTESFVNENPISNQNQSDIIDQESNENAGRSLPDEEVADNDDDWIDIPNRQPTPTNLDNTNNNHLSIRNDTQSNFPDARNIVRKKKQSNNIEKFYTYKCGKCSTEFRNYDSLKKHQLQSHGDIGSAKRSITSNMQGIIQENKEIEELNSYWCSACGKFFQNFESLNVHLQKDHQNTPMRAKRSKMNDKIKRKKVLYYTKY
jgi:hypothetical protein